MPLTGAARTQVFAAKDHAHLTPYLAGLHAQCITSDKSIATFLPPLSHEKLLAWWKDRIAEATAGTRVIVMLLLGSQPGERVQGDSLVGVAMLAIPRAETSPFRASVESVLVSTKYRRRHGATALLGAVEQQAVIRGKTLLIAEVEAGTPGVAVFKQFGFSEAGMIPKYSLSPGGAMKDVVFLYKNLAS